MNKLSRSDVAQALGVAPKTVSRWVTDGCPHEQDGPRLRFDLKAVVAWAGENNRGGVGGWRQDQDAALMQARTRLYNAQAERAENKARDMGVMLEMVTEARRAWVEGIEEVQRVAGKHLTACVPEVQAAGDVLEVESALNRTVRATLTELANG